MALVFLAGRADSFATSDGSSYLRYMLHPPLESGYNYEITEFGVTANTNYAAQATNYETFTLYDEDGNAIGSVNGSSTGVAIGPHKTGHTNTFTSPYHMIDASAADHILYVISAATGAGRAMNGIGFWVKLKRERGDAATATATREAT